MPNAQSQLCHAHLRRPFLTMLEGNGETATQGAMLKLASDRAFHYWHAYLRGEIDRVGLIGRWLPSREIRHRQVILRGHPATYPRRRMARRPCSPNPSAS
ncbi:MAG: hypothetical protein IPN59_02770 [Holophaga sp.]|nr:hypothetical protein [Holophaga sp.]